MRISRSGRVTWASVFPSWPSWPPGLRPVFFRSDRFRGGGLPRPSPDGGFDEFRGDWASRASSSAIRTRARSSSDRASASSARRDTTSVASTSYGSWP